MPKELDLQHVPPSFFDQQYSRSAMYLSHLNFIRKLTPSHIQPSTRIVEFGGSNGFIREAFGESRYEVAENAPEVDVHDLSKYDQESYDFVVLDEILEHVAVPWEAVKQIYGLLKRGGCLITSSPFMIAEHKVPMDYWRFTKDGLRVLLKDFTRVDAYSWGNPASVKYLMNGMMVPVRQAIYEDQFDLSNIEKYAISVWAYAWK